MEDLLALVALNAAVDCDADVVDDEVPVTPIVVKILGVP